MCLVCTDLHPDGQHKLQPPVSPSGGLLKILIKLQQWSAPELWRRMCFRMLLLFWTLFLSYSLFMLILVSQKFVSAGKICTINLNKMFKSLSETEASCDLEYPEYTLFSHRLKLRINGINGYWVLESKYWNSCVSFFSLQLIQFLSWLQKQNLSRQSEVKPCDVPWCQCCQTVKAHGFILARWDV